MDLSVSQNCHGHGKWNQDQWAVILWYVLLRIKQGWSKATTDRVEKFYDQISNPLIASFKIVQHTNKEFGSLSK